MIWRHDDAADIETARQNLKLAACQATNKLHHLADFVEKEKLPSLLFKEVHSAVEAKCNPTEGVKLLREVADAFKHLYPDGQNATVSASIDAAPISMGFARTRPERIIGGPEQVGTVFTNRNGEMRALSSVLQNVLDAWMRLLEQPLSRIDD